MHVTIEITINPPITIAAITGHLQYDCAIQLSQLENVFFTLETSDVIDLGRRLFTNISPTPLRKLEAMASLMCGILIMGKRNIEAT
jgi:hypothetical protein